jgi:hypothetical protein
VHQIGEILRVNGFKQDFAYRIADGRFGVQELAGFKSVLFSLILFEVLPNAFKKNSDCCQALLAIY